jgi:hypothetical protein
MQSGFDLSLATSLCRTTLTGIKQRINDTCDTTSQQIRNSKDRAPQIYRDLYAALKSDMQKLKILDPENQLATNTVWDKIAETLRAAALEANNHANLYKQAYDMLNKALEFASSSSLRRRIQDDLEVVRQSLDTWGDHYRPGTY